MESGCGVLTWEYVGGGCLTRGDGVCRERRGGEG